MDSLLASYASSDDEDEQQPQPPPISSKTTSSSSSLFSFLPPPKSSSSSSPLFKSLPPPKQPSSDTATAIRSGNLSNLSESSSLPKPKSQIQEKPKRIVQFKPPIIPLPKRAELEDDEDDEGEERNRRRKLESSIQTSSVTSFLSTIPAPRNSATLGVQPSSGSGRRSILETGIPAPAATSIIETNTPALPSSSGFSAAETSVPVDQNGGDYQNYQYATDQYDSYGNYSWGAEAEAGASTGTGTGTATSYYGRNDDYLASHGAHEDNTQYEYNWADESVATGQYENNWTDGSMAAAQEASVISESIAKLSRKKGRNEVPVEVIEVKQDELMKNRPREDKAKLTGLAFGPSYQPVSAKGKPSKLLKRKHQIGSLYFDMKQNEMKLAERRAKGMLTKAETQAKYGW